MKKMFFKHSYCTLTILGSVKTMLRGSRWLRSWRVSTMKSRLRVEICMRHVIPWYDRYEWCSRSTAMTSHCLSSSTRAVTSDALEIRTRSVSKRGLAFWWKTWAWCNKTAFQEVTIEGGLHTVGSLSTSCDGSGWHWRISRAYGCGNDALNCEAKTRY